MRKLIFIRHSQTRTQPHIASHRWPLTAEGRRRCAFLAAHLQPYALSSIFTSEEKKAQETGELVARLLKIPVQTAAGLQEHDRTSDAPYFHSEERFKATIERLLTYPDMLVYGRESGTAARERFQKAVAQLIESYPQGNLAIVSHGTVLTLYLAVQFGLDPISFWNSLKQPAYIVVSLPEFKLLDVVNEVHGKEADTL